MRKLEIVDADATWCQFAACKADLNKTMNVRKGFFRTHVVYICQHCRAVLGIGIDDWNLVPSSRQEKSQVGLSASDELLMLFRALLAAIANLLPPRRYLANGDTRTDQRERNWYR